jgi:hypothetical protein
VWNRSFSRSVVTDSGQIYSKVKTDGIKHIPPVFLTSDVNRRALLAGTGTALATLCGGCLDRFPGIGFDVTFERVETDIDADAPPEITVEGETVLVEGTVAYGSTDCAGLELVHARYQRSQERLDLLVAGVDDSAKSGCNDALASQGYRVEATRGGGFRYVSATEHHAQGRVYSASFEE